MTLRETNHILLKLEEDGFITPDEKARKFVTKLTVPKFLYVLKLLFETPQNEFSSRLLVGSLENLANPTLFNHHSKEVATRLELHLRTLVAVLEQICFSQIVLGKELRDKVYNSLITLDQILIHSINRKSVKMIKLQH